MSLLICQWSWLRHRARQPARARRRQGYDIHAEAQYRGSSRGVAADKRDRHAVLRTRRAERCSTRRLLSVRERIRIVHTRHKQGAAYVALGAAMATGKPSVHAESFGLNETRVRAPGELTEALAE